MFHGKYDIICCDVIQCEVILELHTKCDDVIFHFKDSIRNSRGKLYCMLSCDGTSSDTVHSVLKIGGEVSATTP